MMIDPCCDSGGQATMNAICIELPERTEVPHDDIIAHWLKDKHGFDEQFAQAVWEMYFDRLVRLARKELGSLPRRDEDEEDVAQSALLSFLRGADAGRFPQLGDRGDLWRLLFTITVRKAMARKRRFFSKKRGEGEVRGESIFFGNDGLHTDEPSGINEVLGDEPSPELAHEMVETCSDLLDDLRDPELKAIALYKMESYTNEEIAMLLSCSLRTVNRRLDKIRELWADEEQET